MNRTLTISLVFLSGCFFISMPTTIQARTTITNFEKYNLLQTGCLTKITKEEMAILLKDANPTILKRLAEDAELKRLQIKNLKEMVAVACQSIKEGFGENYNLTEELKNIGIELTAVNYDREINKNPMPSFGLISEVQIKEFYANASNQAEFEKFLKSKIELAKENGQIKADSDISKDATEQVKDYFAKTRIYYEEAQRNSDKLPKEFWSNLEFSIKLQKAQYLSGLYSQKVLADKTKVTDEEVQIYIAKHPEFDTKVQKAKASKILRRAKAGENFARLAKKFSEDPGSKDNGGLYEGVAVGLFLPEFEQAALSLKTGRIFPKLVETPYGYHIIKLVKKGEIKDQNGAIKYSFDVRHILISTDINDPDNPANRQIPAKQYVRTKLETEKQKKILGEILTNNPIVVEDFEVPKVSVEPTQQ